MPKTSRFDQALARVCLKCPICRRARRQQHGAAFWLVQKIEVRVCPFCRAYERVLGRKEYERPASAAGPDSRGTD
jgi:hypothetical protein